MKPTNLVRTRRGERLERETRPGHAASSIEIHVGEVHQDRDERFALGLKLRLEVVAQIVGGSGSDLQVRKTRRDQDHGSNAPESRTCSMSSRAIAIGGDLVCEARSTSPGVSVR